MTTFYRLKSGNVIEGKEYQTWTCTGGAEDEDLWCKTERSIYKGQFSNLYSHVKLVHQDWEKTIDEASKGNQSNLNFTYEPYVVAIYGWVDWIVECNLPLTAVNNEHFRKYSNLQSISIKTFIKYLD